MRAAAQLVLVMLALMICTACGDAQQPDIDWMVDPYCEQMVACEWFYDFEVCRQLAISAGAALTHVYGPECGEAWLDLLACESSLACEDYFGCQPENDLYDELCF